MLPAQVELVERVGPDSFVVAHLADGKAINVRVEAATLIREGDRIFLRLPQAKLRVFDAAGQAVSEEGS